MNKKITIQPLVQQSENRFHVKLPPSLYNRINTDQPLQLAFGNRSVLIRANKGNRTLEISQPVAVKLFLPFEEMNIFLRYDNEKQEIKIGPVVAVLTIENTESPPDKPFGAMTVFYQEMARYCKKKHVFFYVLPLQADHAESFVFGYTFIGNQWVKKKMPFPDVIYNRIASRKLEKSETTKKFFDLMQKKNIPIFNERFLNKWEVFHALKEEAVLVPHLPETELYKKASDLDAMLQKHPTIFAKPIHGSLGKGIIKIAQNNGKYFMQFSNPLVQSEEHTLLSLLRAVIPILKRQPYIIQQGIPALTYYLRQTDFRILCIKDQTGNWKVISIVARCSPHDQFVSNIAMGGTLHRPELILSTAFNKRETLSQLKLFAELSLQCARTIEQSFSGIYCELGIDIIIDDNGKPWILEVNTKPSKTEESLFLSSRNSFRPSTKALVQYAAFLANFDINEKV